PLDMLPAARAAGGADFPLLVDGGVRSGGDIIKAIALGADAVLVGRATLYGVAAAGEAGVTRAIEILRDEADLTLALLGCARIGEVDRGLLVEEPR
ncbi:alpha-hydroxy-acid oxidizing protein, partial [Allosphingosinicella sp.]|uniref:alpha-hydroxy-acid oxidizing protein n=1 Tax=Allosphingosinicella sp. TaxID=2823234 RepID=UPI002FC12781